MGAQLEKDKQAIHEEPWLSLHVEGLGFRARVQGLGFRVLGLGFRV